MQENTENHPPPGEPSPEPAESPKSESGGGQSGGATPPAALPAVVTPPAASPAAASRLAYLYLLRIPILLAIFTVGFPYAGAGLPFGASLLRGAYDVQGLAAFNSCLAASLAGWTALITTRLILVYGEERFRIARVAYFGDTYPGKFFVACGSLLGLPALVAIARVYLDEHRNGNLLTAVVLPGVLGCVAALVTVAFSVFLHRCFRNPKQDHIVFPQLRPGLEALLSAGGGRWKYPFQNRFSWVQKLGPGYLYRDPQGNDRLQPGHGYAMAATATFFCAYACFGYLNVNALACLFLFALLWCWMLSASSFLCDYFRVPAFVPILVWVTLVGRSGRMILPLAIISIVILVAAFWLDRRFRQPMRTLVRPLRAGMGLFSKAASSDHTLLARWPALTLSTCLLVLLWLGAVAHWPFPRIWPGRSEHYYAVERAVRPAAPLNRPFDVLHHYPDPSDSDPVAILVAAPGGGIHAAAWTTRVLVGLEEYCRTHPKEGGQRSFSGSIRLISSVSGGSVGTMYFVNAYDPETGKITDEYPGRVVAYSEASSLDPAVKGFVYPDFLRLIVPYFLDFSQASWRRSGVPLTASDRGQWLQEAWADAPTQLARDGGTTLPEELRDMMIADSGRLKDATLDSWRADVAAGKRPAVIFNSSNVDTGRRYLLATTSFLTTSSSEAPLGWRTFADDHANLTMRVATAARLSATFPYVSPSACANLEPVSNVVVKDDCDHNWRLADGGYTNNSGLASLTEWLNEALSGVPFKPPPFEPRILIIEIRNGETGDVKTVGGADGWIFQTGAPLMMALGAIDAGQVPQDYLEVELLRRVSKPVAIDRVQFTYADAISESAETEKNLANKSLAEQSGRKLDERKLSHPLSWHLTPSEIEDVARAWNTDQVRQSCETVAEFLKRRPKAEVPAPTPP